MEKDEPEILNCSGCNLEIDRMVEGVMTFGALHFCLWCWTNDCCRVSGDAAETLKKTLTKS